MTVPVFIVGRAQVGNAKIDGDGHFGTVSRDSAIPNFEDVVNVSGAIEYTYTVTKSTDGLPLSGWAVIYYY